MDALDRIGKVLTERGITLEEAERNLVQKAPKALAAFRELLTFVAAEVAEKPTLEELKQAATYINLKDAPIVALRPRRIIL